MAINLNKMPEVKISKKVVEAADEAVKTAVAKGSVRFKDEADEIIIRETVANPKGADSNLIVKGVTEFLRSLKK